VYSGRSNEVLEKRPKQPIPGRDGRRDRPPFERLSTKSEPPERNAMHSSGKLRHRRESNDRPPRFVGQEL